MISFQNPAAFSLLSLIPAYFALKKAGIFRLPSIPVVFSDWNGKTFSWNSKLHSFLSAVAAVFTVFGFCAAVAALASPVIYRHERVYTSRGADVMFVLDVSPSMAARDIGSATRLDAAKQAIAALVEENQGNAYGLTLMANEAAVAVPPTADAAFFLQRLTEASLGSKGDGTAIGTGLASAVFHLAASGAPKKYIILVTDGENNAGSIHPETAAALAVKNGISVYTVGVGTSGSVPIDYVDPASGKSYSGYLSSVFDPSELKTIARTGGGRYFEIKSAEDLSLALSVIGRAESVVQTYRSKTEALDLYNKFIFAAGVLFILAWCVKRIFLKNVY
ncbi:MAG: VWA domain-containing protein [Treponema sp.]